MNKGVTKLMFCKIGIHRPLRNHYCNFIDKISGKTVFEAECPCGKKWMTDSPGGWGYKIEKSHNQTLDFKGET